LSGDVLLRGSLYNLTKLILPMHGNEKGNHSMATEGPSGDKPKTWRNFLAHELFEFVFNFVFLAIFLVAFAWYRRLILASYHIHYLAYGMPLIEAAILAKVVMIGDALRVGHRLRGQPLALVIVYRAVVFSLFVGLFTLLEHILEALLQGKSVRAGIDAITEKGPDELLGSSLVIFAAFLPFFAMKEMERFFGAEKICALLFRGGAKEAETSSSANH
jgi:hypothetical protein